MKIDAQLLVWLKGSDLFASTAFLTLVGKMGFADRLAGLKRFDYYRFILSAGSVDPDETVNGLKGVLDRQSTFYNRNKHAYSLDCAWDGAHHLEGQSPDNVRLRWLDEISKSLQNNQVIDFDGNSSSKRVIFNKFQGFLAEVTVEDEDTSARDAVATKIQNGLGGISVSCQNRATLWWLALRVENQKEADALARQIAITTRRDSGLLMNPNYQSAEFIFKQVSDD
jgi:hypothetical protein